MQEEDVILCENSIDFAMKSKNPLDNVHFFDNFDSRDKYSMLKNTVSPMYPDVFQASPCLKGTTWTCERHTRAMPFELERQHWVL